MSKEPVWKGWGKRLRAHVASRREITWTEVAGKMDMTDGALRHWIRGRSSPPLEQFFALCANFDADPQAILFADDEQQAQLVALFHHLNDDDRRALLNHAEWLASGKPSVRAASGHLDINRAAQATKTKKVRRPA